MPGSAAQTGYAASPGMFTFFTGESGAVTNNQVLGEWVFPFTAGRISGCEFNAAVAGTGAGLTQIDVLLNGVSIWTGALANRPMLESTGTGKLTQTQPSVKALRYGDVLTVQVTSITGSTGHARVSGSVAVGGQ